MCVAESFRRRKNVWHDANGKDTRTDGKDKWSDTMKLVVGLGNPTSQYKDTRHNVGFRVVDVLAGELSISVRKNKFDALCGDGVWRGRRVLLLKPQTFMNRSGSSVAKAMTFYKLEPDEVLVVMDDMAMELGRLRLRAAGSAGGHNGLGDIIAAIGTDKCHRLRIGIDAAGGGRAVGHVLGRFEMQQEEIVEKMLATAADAAKCWLTEGIDTAMNRHNTKKEDLENQDDN